MKHKKIIIAVIFLLCVVILTGGWILQTKINTYLTASLIDKTLVFTVKKGSNFQSIGKSLENQGILSNTTWWKVIAKLHPELTNIKSGTYELKNGFNLNDILNTFVAGKGLKYTITFIEGHTLKQWLAQLRQTSSLQPLQKNEQEMTAKLAINHTKMEGLLHPGTYYYFNGIRSFSIIEKAYQRQQEIIKKFWNTRDQNLPYKNSYEMLIMASIIEKETGHINDRKKIASVFVNRLRLGMRLQTDPTVIYGMGKRFTGNITTKDLQRKTPYNTYIIKGLPPTPISMPGIASIDAAAHPAKTKYLYFVSKGNGKSHFSNNLKAHNRAVKKYILR